MKGGRSNYSRFEYMNKLRENILEAEESKKEMEIDVQNDIQEIETEYNQEIRNLEEEIERLKERRQRALNIVEDYKLGIRQKEEYIASMKEKLLKEIKELEKEMNKNIIPTSKQLGE